MQIANFSLRFLALSAALILCAPAYSDAALDRALSQNSAVGFTVVPFPPVPENWTQSVVGNAVEYYSPVPRGKKVSDSVVRITYTRNTGGRDALGYINDYAAKSRCDTTSKVGRGFYTTACPEINTYAVAIGEKDNLYLIELTGVYDNRCQALIEDYVRTIITGKHTFIDRYIGDVE